MSKFTFKLANFSDAKTLSKTQSDYYLNHERVTFQMQEVFRYQSNKLRYQ